LAWIHNAFFDLTYLSFGWLALWVAFASWGDTHTKLLVTFVLSVSFIHRTITHLFVYGDPEIFQERKKTYIILPVFLLVVTTVAVLFRQGSFGPKVPYYFLGLAVLSTLWNFYHTIMQKMGMLRIYARKSGVGKAWLDKTILFAWFAYLFLQLPLLPSARAQISGLASVGRTLVKGIETQLSWLPYLTGVALVFALVVTALYIREELKAPEFQWPRNLFLASVLLLFGLFFYDFLAAYAAFGFSHAIEYIAFANLFAQKKYAAASAPPSFMRSFVAKQVLSMFLFGAALFGICFYWNLASPMTLGWLIIGSSFLHFLYDGWIWKLRKPKVASPLGLAPEAAA